MAAPSAIAEQARIAAMRELLDRGYGKATQPLANDTNQPLVVDSTGASDRGHHRGRSRDRLTEGCPIPPNTLAELGREMAHLQFVNEQIKQIEAERLEQLKQAPAAPY
jgi:hypothetical protein